MEPAATVPEVRSYREGEVFCPRHNFKLYKAIRASPTLSMGAKVAWEALVDRLWAQEKHVDIPYRKIALDIGASEGRAKRFVRQLSKERLVRISARHDERDGHQSSNRITFLWRGSQEGRKGEVNIEWGGVQN